MQNLEELRFVAKVARLYYSAGLTQSAIARQLDISQATVSRLLRRAVSEQIVRISVSMPSGVYDSLEDQLEARYNLKRAIVVDCPDGCDDALLLDALGAGAAYYVESTIRQGEVIGISSWSATLLAMVDAMHQIKGNLNVQIVQILGGVGSPSAEIYAARLTERLARAVNGNTVFLPAPGLVASEGAKDSLLHDQFVQEAMSYFEGVTMALVGIGDIQPSRLLASSGNVFTNEELDTLRQYGAVGDICLRFFDAKGQPVNAPLDRRVIGISLEQLQKVRRCVGIAGGERKYAAIRGALEGHWLNVLVTDHLTATRLVTE